MTARFFSRSRPPVLAALGALVLLPVLVSAPARAATTITVAGDGSGNYTTVQAAVNAVPANNTTATTISIKKGTYTGQVTVPANKPYLTFVGATGVAADVVLVDDKPATIYGTQGSATVVIFAPNTTVRSLTIQNSYDEAANGASQALALYAGGDRQVYRNISVLGNQDSLLSWSGSASRIYRQYFYASWISGDVDFIYGDGTAVFDHCKIHSLSRGSSTNNGYITAASTWNTNPYGFLFVSDAFSSNAPAGTVYLGRPWHPGGNTAAIAQVLVRDSTLDAHIHTAQPWTDMSGFSWKDARFDEYHNSGAGATTNGNRPQLTDAQAANYTARKYLAGSDGWDPVVS
jgi:pectinesterase